MPSAISTSTPQVPPFPQVAMRLAALLGKDDCGLKAISDLIHTDIALAGRVIQHANSPLYGRRAPTKSVSQAVATIGLSKVKSIAMAAVTHNYLGKVLKLPEIQACWQHSTACAALTEEIAGQWGLDPATGYTAGLLHDLGRLGLAVAHHKAYAEFLRDAAQSVDPLDREKEVFGADHTETGRQLAVTWRMPAEIVEAAGRHHDVPDVPQITLLFAVQTSCRLASAFGFRSTTLPAPDPSLLLETLPAAMRTPLPEDLAAWRERIAARVATHD